MDASKPPFPYAMSLTCLLCGAGLLLLCGFLRNLPALLCGPATLVPGFIQGRFDWRYRRKGRPGRTKTCSWALFTPSSPPSGSTRASPGVAASTLSWAAAS